MKVYQLQCIKYYPEYYDARDYIFISKDQAHRYGKIFLKLLGSGHGSAFIKEVRLNAHGAVVYVLTEDNHGEIGYFLDRDKAYEAARDVIMENPYWEEWNGHGYDVHEITRDQITDDEIDDYKYLVGIKKYPLNHAWCH